MGIEMLQFKQISNSFLLPHPSQHFSGVPYISWVCQQFSSSTTVLRSMMQLNSNREIVAIDLLNSIIHSELLGQRKHNMVGVTWCSCICALYVDFGGVLRGDNPSVRRGILPRPEDTDNTFGEQDPTESSLHQSNGTKLKYVTQ